MPVTDMLLGIAVIVACAIVVVQIARTVRARSLHRTIATAITSDSPHAEPLIAKLDRRPRISERLIGLVLLALALGIVGVGALLGEGWDDWQAALAAALFPALIGAALLLYRRLTGEPDGR